MNHNLTRFLSWLLLLFPVLPECAAQCTNWSASTQLVSGATCAGNGSFNVTLHGPDAGSLSNIQYGIPVSANGISVPLNNSSGFTNLPPGVYQVSVVADCGNLPVGRNATITIPGAYTAPAWDQLNSYVRSSFNCASTGQIVASVTQGVLPLTFTLRSAPAAYTGARTWTLNYNGLMLDSLPPGTYILQASDACANGTVLQTFTVNTENPLSAPFSRADLTRISCDSVRVYLPRISSTLVPWRYYEQDPAYQVSARIGNGISSTVGPRPVGFSNQIALRLAAGKTLKDLYRKYLIYTVAPVCGPVRTDSFMINPPILIPEYQQRCDSEAVFILGALNLACLPISYKLRNTVSGRLYGPFVTNGVTIATPPVPIGMYRVLYTTGDGYSDSTIVAMTGTSAKPFGVRVIPGNMGLHNFAGGFHFTDSNINIGGNKRIELFSGPAGYSFNSTWSSYEAGMRVTANMSPGPTTLFFPPGNYIWKITDDCGTYFLPVTVDSSDLCQYSVSAPVMTMTCNGMSILPQGAVTANGLSKPVYFMIYLNGQPYRVPAPGGGSLGTIVAAGTPVLLTTPGIYSIIPTGVSTGDNIVRFYSQGGFSLGIPNPYNASFSFAYAHTGLSVDLTQTQGFLCAGAGNGQAQIFGKGKGGMPFQSVSNPNYLYQLAAAGAGLNGPYIASNTTGIFTGFGGAANGLYDLKVSDSCGAFAIQQVKVLDLGRSRLISSSRYVACAGDSIRLSAIFLPNATYSWNGPGGFTSTQREPLILNAAAVNAGLYRVIITTGYCNQPVSDSARLVINPLPVKPIIDYICSPRPITLNTTNPQPGVGYSWDIGTTTVANPTRFVHYGLERSDTLQRKYVWRTGSYAAVAIDSVYGCRSRSDSLVFRTVPEDSLRASVYSPHLDVCTGDSTILVAQWTGADPLPRIQWLRDNVVIQGATAVSITTNVAGNYSVIVDGGLCNRDTSASVRVRVVALPSDSLSADRSLICSGDTALLKAATGAGFGYAWERNGVLIPGANAAAYPATIAGDYVVRTSNGACFITSPAVRITVRPAPAPEVRPVGARTLCPNETLTLRSETDPEYHFQWTQNGTAIPGANADTFEIRLPGIFQVVISTGWCRNIRSEGMLVNYLPGSVNIGNDTLICQENQFPLRLAADSGFTWYDWNTKDSTRSILATGTGTYIVTAYTRCGHYSDTMRIRNGDDFLPRFPDDTVICTSTQRVELRVPPGLSQIRWSTGARSESISVDSSGLYFVSAQGPCGGIADTINVRFCLPAIRDIQGLATICAGQCAWPQAKADGHPKTYAWQFPGGNPANAVGVNAGRICFDTAGVYPVTLIVTNKGGSDTATFEIVVQARPQLRFRDTLVTAGYNKPLRLPACAQARVADWYADGALICRNCAELQLQPQFHYSVYRCVVRDNDCPDSCSYTLRVVDIPNDVWLPNAFTPNGDGRNDYFGIITGNPNVQVGNLSVYNRWGERVFLSNRNDRGWDGSFNGKAVDAGTYFWQLTYTILGRAEAFHQKGDLLLIR